MSDNPLIEKLSIRGNRLDVSANRRFTRRYLLDDFYVEYDESIDLGLLDPSITIIPFVANVIPIVWCSGKEYQIESLDAEFAASLEKIHTVYREIYPEVDWSGRLVVQTRVKNPPPIEIASSVSGPKLGVLFSGGLDSVCTSLRHVGQPQLLITIWGAGVALENIRGWEVYCREFSEFATGHGHQHATIKSNFLRFLFTTRLKTVSRRIPNWWTYVQHGLGLTGLTAPLLRQECCTKLLMASSHTVDNKEAWGAYHAIYQKLSWAGTHVVNDDYEVSRQAKIRAIKEICEQQGTSKPALKVCFSETRSAGDNCCRCEKCLRTITGLLIEGEEPRVYGLGVTGEETLKRVEDGLRKFTLAMIGNSVFYWREIQRRVREVLENDVLRGRLGTVLVTSFERLSAVDLDAYVRRYAHISRPSWLARLRRTSIRSLGLRLPFLGRRWQRVSQRRHFRAACEETNTTV